MSRDTPNTNLPRGCALGIQVVQGVPAIELLKLVTDDDGDRLLELGRRGVYPLLLPETRTLFDQFPDENQVVNIRFLNASLLHCAVQMCSINAAMALILLDPELINKNATLLKDGDTTGIMCEPTQMALLYSTIGEIEYQIMFGLLLKWRKLINNGLFSEYADSSSRITLLGSDTLIVYKTILLVGSEKWFKIFEWLIDNDMYSMIVALDRTLATSVELTTLKMSYNAYVPSRLRPFFADVQEGTTIKITNMNLLHYALVKGRYAAACALLVMCPALAFEEVTLVQNASVSERIDLSPRMIVKFFGNEHSEQERLSCFKILTQAFFFSHKFELITLKNRTERVRAAGNDVNALMARWVQMTTDTDVSYAWSEQVSMLGRRPKYGHIGWR